MRFLCIMEERQITMLENLAESQDYPKSMEKHHTLKMISWGATYAFPPPIRGLSPYVWGGACTFQMVSKSKDNLAWESLWI